LLELKGLILYDKVLALNLSLKEVSIGKFLLKQKRCLSKYGAEKKSPMITFMIKSWWLEK
jgi:hypothetical protein